MLFRKTNLLEKLHLEKEKQRKSEENILSEVRNILDQVDKSYSRIEDNLSLTDTVSDINSFDFDLLESDKIFHIDQIKSLCIDYRLRFLDSKYFKGEIPVEAYAKIRKLEQEHTIEIKGFKIIAPSRLFKLEDKDDPLLFAPIGNGYYYLIHKWGNDLHPFRKMMMWPFKNVGNLIFVIVLISYLTTLLIPNGLFSKSNSVAEFGILFFFTFKSIVAVAIFYGFALGKNFSPAIWNSKYYNA
ncbi:hypothetical protein [Maribacter cobaltidurans]|uniref:Uncharacterized protein n=1 Tax=Maribacter cobaltidurans TaxID=1178778 RepID=A0A223VA38_9FLAO|nr:hypothetical protein [Maribacter cobaltidurans]ASV32020.1 hypothetical protein CJ263_18360 [Maribacter cobaltidurans]GGD86540.1 hypothetical protein GCM10011412_25460 [Maribacter cobaltidurans]